MSWSWNVIGVALWVILIVYLVFIIQDIRRRRLKMIIKQHKTFDGKNFVANLIEVAVFLLALGWLGNRSLFYNPDLTDKSAVTSHINYEPLVLQSSGKNGYYVTVKSTKTRTPTQTYTYYVDGKKWVVPGAISTISYGKNPINITAEKIPYVENILNKKDDQYQNAYVATYVAKYKNTLRNGLGMHAGKVATRFYLIRVPDTTFIEEK